MKSLNVLLAALLLIGGPAAAADGQRWYSEQQVAEGARLFRENCASCHGDNAEATPNWKQTDANGKYPPPPLNGTAHAWHHDLEQLRRSIREGGARIGGQMPGFEGRLGTSEIDSVIAFFQSKWPEDIYQRWSGRFASAELPAISEPMPEPPVTRLLRQRIGDATIEDVRETPLDGVWQARIGNRYVYLLEGGKYVMMGEMIDLEQGHNLTEQSRREVTLQTLSEFSDDDLVIFPAEGESRAVLNVFTDTSCPYCQKLHGEIGELQQAGITVRYLPFPRGGSKGPGYRHLKSVWCAKDRRQAMTDAKNEQFDDLPPGDCDAAAVVDRGYRAGVRIGITGTPTLIRSNGEKIDGYRPHQQLIPMLLQ